MRCKLCQLILTTSLLLSSTPANAQDSLINLVQWPISQGGNDHWYGIIPVVQNWLDHRAQAESFTIDDSPGYLATITTASENQFILDSLLKGNTNQPSINDQFFIGGFNSSGWEWITGEDFGYTHWSFGEPSGDGPALAMWGASKGGRSGFWNDVPHAGSPSSIFRIWSVVEFGANMSCGDANGDGVITNDDLTFLINFYFMSGDPPINFESSDVNIDGVFDLSDIIFLANFLNGIGPAPCTGSDPPPIFDRKKPKQSGVQSG